MVRHYFALRRLGFSIGPGGEVHQLPGPSLRRIKAVARGLLAANKTSRHDDNRRPTVSIVVPVRNEAGNIAPLVDEIAAAVDGQWPFEVVYVNDGSNDTTDDELARAEGALSLAAPGAATSNPAGSRRRCAAASWQRARRSS